MTPNVAARGREMRSMGVVCETKSGEGRAGMSLDPTPGLLGLLAEF